MALAPRADDRPVLEQEEEAERRERQEDGEPGERGDPGREPVDQRVERVADARAGCSAGALRLSALTPASWSWSWSLPTAFWSPPSMALAWLDDPDEHEHPDNRPDHGSATNTSTAAAPAACAAARRHRHRRQDAAMIVAAMTGMTIGGQREQRDGAGQERHDADEQPGDHAEVAQPARRREDAGQLARLEVDEVGRLGVRGSQPSGRSRRTRPRRMARRGTVTPPGRDRRAGRCGGA